LRWKNSSPVSRTDLLLTFLAMIWGVNYVVLKQTLEEILALAFNALRFSFASILLFLNVWLFEGGILPDRKDFNRIFGLGIIGYALHQALFICGVSLTTASLSALLMATSPVFVVLLNLFIKVEKLSGRIFLGVILSLAGVLVLVVGSQPDLALTGTHVIGGGLILLSAILWAAYTVLAKPCLGKYSPLRLTTLTMIFGTIVLDIVAIPSLLAQQWRAVSLTGWAGFGYSFGLTAVVGYLIWNIGIQRCGPARTAIYQNLTPVIATVASYFVLGEILGKLQVVGAAMIFLGIYLTKKA